MTTTASDSPGRDPATPSLTEPHVMRRPAHRLVAVLGLILLTLMAVVGTVGAVSVRSIEQDLGIVVKDDVRVLVDLQAIHQLVARGQLSLEQAATASSTTRVSLLAAFDASLADAIARWNTSASDPAAPDGATDPAVFNAWVIDASSLREQLADGAEDADLRTIRTSFESLSSSFEAGIVPLATQVQATAEDALNRADLARRILLAVAAIGLGVGAVVYRSTYRAAAAQHREITERDAERSIETARNRIATRVARAFDYARTDADTLEAAEQALRELHPERPTELLLADSSGAHFEVGFRTHAAASLPGCGVATPNDCPAVIRAQTLLFDTSNEFDACPHLKNRPSGPVSAICVPVSISGTAAGVLHSTGADGEVLDAETRNTIDLIAVRAGDRIGVLRAFSRSETQAATDPLTGLANRRSFENRISALFRAGRNVTIVFGDLDHFKQLNDSHGHDAGDRALRSFARAFRHSVRPGDLIARWGGEEFVAAFPDTTSDVVVDILQRLQGQLASLVDSGGVPPVTVSFGIADRRDGDDLEALVSAADRALLAAKRGGRNQVVLASSLTLETTPAAHDSGIDRVEPPRTTRPLAVVTTQPEARAAGERTI